ncbi:flavin reductase family protein [Microbacterium horticulturae]|uniref:Flavin reductase family protein n=1 Tax=Microbacterium horticulturae TaxID=3028316 RepID=A0ABY8BWD5_9MICO|nr:flavin reductase family protein [Microbacterium sp. KACC 23027]WEG08474.1 flavin reductase family protein [Microbacterium sp. KACC 23027]
MTATEAEPFKAAMSALATAVTVVASRESGSPVAMVMGTLTMVSEDPPLVAVLPKRSSSTWRRVAATGRFTASVLAADQREIVAGLAGRSDARFSRIDWDETEAGGAAVAGCVSALDAEIQAEHVAGDHLIVVARVVGLRVDEVPSAPLLFFRRAFHRTIPVPDLPTSRWH